MKNRIIITLSIAVLLSMMDVNAQDKSMDFKQLFPIGEKLSESAAKNFIGQAYLAPLTELEMLHVPAFNVPFEPDIGRFPAIRNTDRSSIFFVFSFLMLEHANFKKKVAIVHFHKTKCTKIGKKNFF